MTSPDPTSILAQINSARDQTYQNIALTQAHVAQANAAAEAAARDRAAVAAISQQAVTVDTSVGTRVFAGDVMIFGDTGRRNISDLLQTGNSSAAYLWRIGSLVNILFNVWTEAGWTSGDVGLVLPVGFRTQAGTYWGRSYDTNGLNLYTRNPGELQFFGSSPDEKRYFRGFYTFATSDPWPTSLPGTPA